MRKINLKTILLIVILFTAVFFRFYALDRHDVLTDEASISFRAIGYLDFLATPYQTTPLEWMEERPLWTYLSFHDHPPLNFLIQFVFFKVFAVSIFIMRLPAALFGVLSVLILYLIGRRLGGELPGLLAAGILAINDYHIWVSRIALQESAAIFFILLSFLILLKAISFNFNKSYFYLFGLVSGLALLIKIHAIIIFPIAFIYIWFAKRGIFKTKALYWSLLISLAVFSPYIIYNIFLFKTFGHFDFQFSYLLGQDVPEWSIRPGRFEFQTFNERFKFFFVNLKETLSPLIFWVSFISVAALAAGVFKKKIRANPKKQNQIYS